MRQLKQLALLSQYIRKFRSCHNYRHTTWLTLLQNERISCNENRSSTEEQHGFHWEKLAVGFTFIMRLFRNVWNLAVIMIVFIDFEHSYSRFG